MDICGYPLSLVCMPNQTNFGESSQKKKHGYTSWNRFGRCMKPKKMCFVSP